MSLLRTNGKSLQYALLFPGETFAREAGMPASKESVWALTLRAIFLWHACVRWRADVSLLASERAQYAMVAWLELDAIEAATERHTCGLATLQIREALFR